MSSAGGGELLLKEGSPPLYTLRTPRRASPVLAMSSGEAPPCSVQGVAGDKIPSTHSAGPLRSARVFLFFCNFPVLFSSQHGVIRFWLGRALGPSPWTHSRQVGCQAAHRKSRSTEAVGSTEAIGKSRQF